MWDKNLSHYHLLKANTESIRFRNSIYCHWPNSKDPKSPIGFDKLEKMYIIGQKKVVSSSGVPMPHREPGHGNLK